MGMSGGMGMNRPMSSAPSPMKPTMTSSKTALPDTDMEDADNMIRRR